MGNGEGEVINKVLGNASLEKFLSNDVQIPVSENEKIKIHLKYVEDLLRMAQSNDAGNKSRADNILQLQQYWEKGIFPRGEYFDGDTTRRPNFRDSQGNLCAVGFLIQNSPYGGQCLVDLISRSHTFDYITDMLHLPELVAWQEKSGLSVTELAMIQPTYEFVYSGRMQEILPLLTELATSKASQANLDDKQKSLSDNISARLRNLGSRDGTFGMAPGLRRMATERFHPQLEDWRKKHFGKSDAADQYFLEVEKQVQEWMGGKV